MTIYYVSPTGDDDNPGTEASPFKNIQKAADKVNPGDTVIVKDGIYTDTNSDNIIVNFKNNGTSDKWITFKSENKWGAVLDGHNYNVAPIVYGMNFGGADYGLDSSYTRVENFDMKDCEAGIWDNAKAHHLYFFGNKIHHMGRDGGGGGAFIGEGTHHTTFDSNLIYTNGGLNMLTTPQNPDCDYNDCYTHDHGIYAYGSNNTIINNIFYDHLSGWDIQISGGCEDTDGPNWLISNNVFDSANSRIGYGSAIAIWTRNCTLPLTRKYVTNVIIQNNIFNQPYGNYAIRVDNVSHTAQLSHVYQNNIVYGANNIAVAHGATWDDAYIKGWTEKNNFLSTNPLFINRDKRDYHLQSTSPAIEKGTTDKAPLYDFDGNPRTGHNDIGAFQYIGTTQCLDLLTEFKITKI